MLKLSNGAIALVLLGKLSGRPQNLARNVSFIIHIISFKNNELIRINKEVLQKSGSISFQLSSQGTALIYKKDLSYKSIRLKYFTCKKSLLCLACFCRFHENATFCSQLGS